MRLLLLFFLIPISLFSQQPFLADVWLNENRASVSANVLWNDANGYLLVGTDQGVFRYNGTRFSELFAKERSPVTAMAEYKGKIWVGYKNGHIGYIYRDSIYLVAYKNYTPSAAVHSILGLTNGTLCLGTEQGIILLKEGHSRKITTADGLSDDFIYTLQYAGKDHLLAGTDQGINEIFLINGRVKVAPVALPKWLPDNIIRVIRPNQVPGTYWIGMQQGGFALYVSATKSCLPLRFLQPWIYGQINDVLPLNDNSAWMATEDGYLLEVGIQGNQIVVVREVRRPGSKFNALLLDTAGNIWCGTNSGLSRNTGEFLDHIDLPIPFSLSEVTAMCFDQDNVLWLAQKKVLYRVVTTGAAPKMVPVFQFAAPVSVLHCDAANQLWVGTAGKGLWVKCPDRDGIEQVEGLALEQENMLSITSTKQRLWVAGLNGVKEFSFTGLRQPLVKFTANHNKASGIGSDYVYQLYADKKDRIWMATDGAGVRLYEQGRYHHWPVFDADPANVVYSLTQDAKGSIWAGSIYKNLSFYSKGRWQNTMDHEMQDIDINLSAINANASGQLVAVYQRCIDLWYPWAKNFRHFNNRQDWGIDSNASVLNCTAKDKDGNVYVPYNKGMLIFKNQRKEYIIQPRIHILEVNNNLRAVNSGTDVAFGPDENYFRFKYDGISFTNPERLNYRYQLRGYNEKWVYTNETVASFSKLPPGDFTFVVQASLNNFFDHAAQAEFHFVIGKPLWLRTWFIILVSVCIIAVSYGLLKFRDRKMQRLAQLEQERVLFDYEHLKSQVNPHFLFNSLNTLVNLIEESPENAINYTEKLSDLYRSMLVYHNRDLITLAEEWEILSAYLHIQQSRFGKALQIHGEIPNPKAMQKQLPPMALQLLVENAIKHNVVSLTEPLLIIIEATDFEVRVRNEIKPKIKPSLESGIGLSNIDSRYRLLTKRKMSYGVVDGFWVVQLPLL